MRGKKGCWKSFYLYLYLYFRRMLILSCLHGDLREFVRTLSWANTCTYHVLVHTLCTSVDEIRKIKLDDM